MGGRFGLRSPSLTSNRPFSIPYYPLWSHVYPPWSQITCGRFYYLLVCSKLVRGRYGWNWSAQDLKYGRAALAASRISNPELTNLIWNWLLAGWDLVSGRATQWRARYQIEHCQQTISTIYNEVQREAIRNSLRDIWSRPPSGAEAMSWKLFLIANLWTKLYIVPYLQRFLFWIDL